MTPNWSFLLSVCLAVVTVSCLYVTLSQTVTNNATSRLRPLVQQSSSPSGRIDDNNNKVEEAPLPAFASVMNPLSLIYSQMMPSRGYAPSSVQSTAAATTTDNNKIPPIHVLVCVEALCIDSKRFFHDQLMTTFNALPHDVVNWKVVPYGNAKMPQNSSSHTPTCQHGAGECDTNTYQQCAIHLYPDPIQHIPYLACLFASLPMGHRDDPFDQWTGLEPCAHEHGLSFDKIKQCHDDPLLRYKLNQQAAEATPSQHTHVPWVEINGMHREDIDEQESSLLREVCKIYRQNGGHNAGCSKFSG